jgi:NAD dependent epimerase/dehydratase family enzyme
MSSAIVTGGAGFSGSHLAKRLADDGHQVRVIEMRLKNVRLKFTPGAPGGRGWVDDVKVMLLATSKLTNLGWHPALKSREAVKLAAHELLVG